jgi:alanyl-tRNA synthetase
MFVRLLLTAILATTLASAQRGGGGGGGRGGGGGGGAGGGGGMMMPQRQSKANQFADKLKLSKEQQEEANTALMAAVQELAPVRAEMDKSRVAIAGALIEGKGGDELKKLMDEYASAAAQMTGIEVKAFSKVYASLKPNQQAKAGQAYELLAEALDSMGGGGGGRGGRGRGRQ